MKAKNNHEVIFSSIFIRSFMRGRVDKLLTVRVKELAKHKPQATKTGATSGRGEQTYHTIRS